MWITIADPVLIDLLRHQNGGEIADDWNAFPTSKRTSWTADHVPFDRPGQRPSAGSSPQAPHRFPRGERRLAQY